jgi:hypothetical protein
MLICGSTISHAMSPHREAKQSFFINENVHPASDARILFRNHPYSSATEQVTLPGSYFISIFFPG